MKAFVMSQFSFVPLLSMFCNRPLNSKIDLLHFRSLRIVYNDNLSSFDELLNIDKSVRLHHRNIQFLAIEMYKVKLGIAPSFMSDIFKIRDISTDSIIRRLRSPLEFYNYDIPKSVRYGEETLRSLRPKVWHILPSDIKSSQTLVIFKNRIKLWIPKNWPCRLCKPYNKFGIFVANVFIYLLYYTFCLFFFFFDIIALNKPTYIWFLRVLLLYLLYLHYVHCIFFNE